MIFIKHKNKQTETAQDGATKSSPTESDPKVRRREAKCKSAQIFV